MVCLHTGPLTLLLNQTKTYQTSTNWQEDKLNTICFNLQRNTESNEDNMPKLHCNKELFEAE